MLNADMTMSEALCHAVKARKEQEALVCDSVRLSYEQLGRRVHRLAYGLHSELGIHTGDKVATRMFPGPGFACLFFALVRLGAVIVPLDPGLRPRGMDARLRDAEPTALVSCLPVDEEMIGEVATLRRVIGVDDSDADLSLDDLMMTEGAAPSIDISPDDLLALLYTSGTTGVPKGTMHSHRSLIAPVAATFRIRQLWQRPSSKMLGKQIKALVRYRERLLRAAGRPQTFLSTIGWHTISGVQAMLQALLMGDKLVAMPRFHPRRALELVERENVTILIAVPMGFQVMLRLEGFEEYDTSSLIVCGTGAAPCPPRLAQEVERRFGCAIHIGFGATETAGGIAVTNLADSQAQRTETVGRPLSDIEIKIVDEKRRELPPGKVGELACRSDSVMLGYYGDPESTAEVMDEDNWYYTGDLAMMDGDGYLHVVGRKKDMIIRGGKSIYPAEIEDYLTAHPKIREAAVVGVPATLAGESVWAFIVLEEGTEMTAREVKTYCGKALEPFKIPSEVRFVADYPRAQSGKPQKFRLRQTALVETQGQEAR